MGYKWTALLAMLWASAVVASPITYQGLLQQGDELVDGETVNLQFTLYDDETDGTAIGDPLTRRVTPVDGVFQVILDFGATAFTGSSRFLEVKVDEVVLSARQRITSAPRAIVADTVALSAIGEAQVDATAVQLRVTDACTGPRYVQGINQDGSVVCSGSGSNITSGESNTISGGGFNDVSGFASVIGGGQQNKVSADWATVSGGLENEASGDHATVGGGVDNAAEGRFSTVSGGQKNKTVEAHATVGGGFENTASGAFSVVGGGRGNHSLELLSVIAGGENNTAGGLRASITGGAGNRAEGDYSIVAGGRENTASGDTSVVAGGDENINAAEAGTVSGGRENEATAQALWSSIGGGQKNTADAKFAALGGGDQNKVLGEGGVIAGGILNTAEGNQATVAGGLKNNASGVSSTISGGGDNTAAGFGSVVAGGLENTAVGDYSMISGGSLNAALGAYSIVSGGQSNCAGGNNSWAGGTSAKVRPAAASEVVGCDDVPSASAGGDHGTFVWADSQPGLFISSGANQFLVRASGGAVITFGDNVRVARNDPVGNRLLVDGSLGITELESAGFGVSTSTPLCVNHHVDDDFYRLAKCPDSNGSSSTEATEQIQALTKRNAELEQRLAALEAILFSDYAAVAEAQP